MSTLLVFVSPNFLFSPKYSFCTLIFYANKKYARKLLKNIIFRTCIKTESLSSFYFCSFLVVVGYFLVSEFHKNIPLERVKRYLKLLPSILLNRILVFVASSTILSVPMQSRIQYVQATENNEFLFCLWCNVK